MPRKIILQRRESFLMGSHFLGLFLIFIRMKRNETITPPSHIGFPQFLSIIITLSWRCTWRRGNQEEIFPLPPSLLSIPPVEACWLGREGWTNSLGKISLIKFSWKLLPTKEGREEGIAKSSQHGSLYYFFTYSSLFSFDFFELSSSLFSFSGPNYKNRITLNGPVQDPNTPVEKFEK